MQVKTQEWWQMWTHKYICVHSPTKFCATYVKLLQVAGNCEPMEPSPSYCLHDDDDEFKMK